MGRVVLGHDRKLGRDVALKEVPPGLDPAYGARLAREAAIAARLDHPGIVPVHDVGRHADGALFVAMRIVRGRSLAELTADPAVPRERLLRAVLAAAEALGFAHSSGVVHRDVKPANIMVGEFGETQVVDWGLARDGVVPSAGPRERRAGTAPGLVPGVPDNPRDSDLTRAGAIIGTPQYMAPEQAQGYAADARSDVWSLGAVLFEVMTGRPPHIGDDPALVLLHAAERQAPPVQSLTASVAPELAAIIDKALALVPELRYPNAKALADDLARYLDGRLVAAYAYSTFDLVRRLYRAWRIPILVTAAALFAVAVSIGLAFSASNTARERAEAAEVATRAALLEADLNLSRALASQATSQPPHARPEAEILAAASLDLHEAPLARGLLTAWAAARRPSLREEHPLPPDCPHPIVGVRGEVVCRDNVSLPVRDVDGELRMAWNAGFIEITRGAARRLFQPCGPSKTWTVAVQFPRDRWLAICRGGQLVSGRFADEGLTVVGRLAEPFEATAAAFVGDTGAVLVGNNRGEIALLELSSATFLWRATALQGAVFELDVSADGRIAAVLGDQGGILLHDLSRRLPTGRLPTRWARSLHFDADDPRRLLAVGPTLRVWTLPEPYPLTIPAGGGVSGVATRGDRVAIAADRSLALRRAPSLDPSWSAAWDDGTVKAVDILSDGRVVAVNAGRPEVRVYQATPEDAAPDTPDHTVIHAGEHAHARRVAVLDANGADTVIVASYHPSLFAVAEGAEAVTLAEAEFIDLSIAADRRAAVALRDTPRAVCRITTHPAVALERCDEATGIVAVALAPDHALAYGAAAQEVRAFDTTGAVRAHFPTDGDGGGHLIEVAASADGRWLAAGDSDGTTWIWRVADRRLMARLRDHDERVTSLAFLDGDLLVTGSWDGSLRIRDLRSLDIPAASLRAEIEEAWGLNLDDVITDTPR